MVRVILNVIWLVLAGLWMAIAYALVGLVACILIITIPFGIAAFRIANYVLWPFGRTTVPRRDAGVGSLIGNSEIGISLKLARPSGMPMIVRHKMMPVIRWASASFKLIPISLLPLGVEIVSTDEV